jgi:hypothetical protein
MMRVMTRTYLLYCPSPDDKTLLQVLSFGTFIENS